jgi:quinohemoprotein ethanol dehydrogenase
MVLAKCSRVFARALTIAGLGLHLSSGALGASGDMGAGSEWATYGGDYGNTRFSRLAQIDVANVDQLELRWSFSTGLGQNIAINFQTNPLVVDGVMFVTDPGARQTTEQHVFALDAKTGDRLWESKLSLSTTPDILGFLPSRPNRGVAFGKGRVYVATLDARLWALDASSGRPIKDFGDGRGPYRGAVTVADIEAGYYETMAPLFIPRELIPVGGRASGHDLVVLGVSGAENETRGFISAYDADTGELLWRFFTVPEPGEFGSDTWPTILAGPFADPFNRGGGSAWMTPAYDPELGLLYQGIGNAGPDFDGTHRDGANLFTVSILALNVATGERAWHFQEVHHDLWDYDQSAPPVLFDINRGPSSVKAVGAAGKTGWFYILNRLTGRPIIPCPEQRVPTATDVVAPDGTLEQPYPTQPHCKSDPFVPQGDRSLPSGRFVEPIFTPPGAPTGEVGPFGLPIVSSLTVPTGDALIEPAVVGGSDWSPVSYNPRQGLAYIMGTVAPMRITAIPADKPTPGQLTFGGTLVATRDEILSDFSGAITAMDVKSGKVRWQTPTETVLVGGSCTTAGGLVFAGEADHQRGQNPDPFAPDTFFTAFDAANGQRLWRYPIPGRAGVNAPCVSYEVDGEQFIAVAAGGTFFGFFQPGDTIYVFGLPR